MPLIVDGISDALFAPASAPAADCTCGRASWCPACGTWEPPTTDLEVLEAVDENSRSRRVADRVIRKPLEK